MKFKQKNITDRKTRRKKLKNAQMKKILKKEVDEDNEDDEENEGGEADGEEEENNIEQMDNITVKTGKLSKSSKKSNKDGKNSKSKVKEEEEDEEKNSDDELSEGNFSYIKKNEVLKYTQLKLTESKKKYAKKEEEDNEEDQNISNNNLNLNLNLNNKFNNINNFMIKNNEDSSYYQKIIKTSKNKSQIYENELEKLKDKILASRRERIKKLKEKIKMEEEEKRRRALLANQENNDNDNDNEDDNDNDNDSNEENNIGSSRKKKKEKKGKSSSKAKAKKQSNVKVYDKLSDYFFTDYEVEALSDFEIDRNSLQLVDNNFINIKKRVNKELLESYLSDDSLVKTVMQKKIKLRKGVKYGKGKENPLIKEYERDFLKESKNPNLNLGCCIACNNKNVYRAVYTNNMGLLENCFKARLQISGFNETWGADQEDTSPIHLCLQNIDDPVKNEMLNKILEFYILNDSSSNKRKRGYNQNNFYINNSSNNYSNILGSFQFQPEMFNRVHKPMSKLQMITSGKVSIKTFGHEVRAVQLSRGSRQGNNAFFENSSNTYLNTYSLGTLISNALIKYNISDENYTKLSAIITNPFMRNDNNDFIMGGNPFGGGGYNNYNNNYGQSPVLLDSLVYNVPQILLTGNMNLAKKIIEENVDKRHIGFNHVFLNVLKLDNAEEFIITHKISVNKKCQLNQNITPVHAASINPNHEILEKLVENGGDIFAMDVMNRKPVHYAACCSSPLPLEYLNKKLSCNVEEKDKEKFTPLIYAAKSNRLESVRYLLEVGVDAKAKNKQGWSAIHFAALYNNLPMINILIREGKVPVDLSGPESRTAMIIAAEHNNIEAVKLLIAYGGKVTKKDKFKRTPLLMAVKYGHIKTVSFLLKEGSDFNQGDSSENTPLHYACAFGWLEIIDLLIKSGASIDKLNSWKYSCIEIAMLKNHFGIIKHIINKHEVNVDVIFDQGRTLIHNSMYFLSDEAYKDELEFLIKDKKANVNIQDIDGEAVLHILARYSFSEYCKFGGNQIIESRLELIRKTLSGNNNNLYSLSLDNDMGIQEVINLKKEVKENYKNLVRKTFDLIVNIAQGDINIETKEHKTPLQIAIENKNFTFIELILKHKPRLVFIDKNNNSILHLLCNYLFDEEAKDIIFEFLELLKTSRDKIQILNHYNDFGFTPLLWLGLKYRKEISGYYSMLMAKEQKKIKIKIYELAKKENPGNLNNFINNNQGNNRRSDLLVLDENEEDEEGEEDIDDDDDEDEEEDDEPRKKRHKKPVKAKAKVGTMMSSNVMGLNSALNSIGGNNSYLGGRSNYASVNRMSNISSMSTQSNNSSLFSQAQGWQGYNKYAAEYNISFHNRSEYEIINSISLKNTDIIKAQERAIKDLDTYIETFIIKIIQIFQDLGCDILAKTIKLKAYRVKKKPNELLPEENKANNNINMFNNNYDDEDDYDFDYGGMNQKSNNFFANNQFNNNNMQFKKKAFIKKAEKSRRAIYGGNFAFNNINDDEDDNDEENDDSQQREVDDAEFNHYYEQLGDMNIIMLINLYPVKFFCEYIINSFKGDVSLEDSDIKGNTMLMLLLKNYSSISSFSQKVFYDCFNYFLEINCDVNCKDNNGNNLCILSAKSCLFDILETLCLEKNSNINHMNNFGENPLIYFVRQKNKPKVLELIHKFKIDINYKDDFQRTVVHYLYNDDKSSETIDISLIKIILSQEPNLNYQDINGRTALHYLFVKINNEYDNTQIDPVVSLTTLLDKNVQVNLKDKFGNNVLHYAAQRGATISSLDILSKDSSLINDKNNEGNTPFGYSLIFGHPNYSVHILSQNADIKDYIFPLDPRTEDEILLIEVIREKNEEIKNKELKVKEEEGENNNNIPNNNRNENVNNQNNFNQIKEKENQQINNFINNNNNNNNNLNPNNKYFIKEENLTPDRKKSNENEKDNDNNKEKDKKKKDKKTYAEIAREKKKDRIRQDLKNKSHQNNNYNNNYNNNFNNNPFGFGRRMNNNQFGFNSYSNNNNNQQVNAPQVFRKAKDVNLSIFSNIYIDYIEKKNNLSLSNDENLAKEESKTNIFFSEYSNNPQTDDSFKTNSEILNFIESYKMSLYRLCVKKNYQGLMHLFTGRCGYCLSRAIADSLMEQKSNLALLLLEKERDIAEFQRLNSLGQNLFHIFALHFNTDNSTESNQLLDMFNEKGLNPLNYDYLGCNLIHYTCLNLNFYLMNYIQRNIMLNPAFKNQITNTFIQQNKEKMTPFLYSIKGKNIEKSIEFLKKFFTTPEYITNYQYNEKTYGENYHCTPIIHVVRYFPSSYGTDLLVTTQGKLILFLNKFKTNLMDKDEKGVDCLMHCARQNNYRLLEALITNCQRHIDKNSVDNENRSLIHYIVSPIEEGSYENKWMLSFALKHNFSAVKKDKNNLTPIDYAVNQRSGVNLNVFKENNIIPNNFEGNNTNNKRKNSMVEVFSEYDFVYDYNKDHEQYYTEMLNKYEKFVRVLITPDPVGNFSEKVYEVVKDEDGYYDCLMTKVNINNSIWGEFLFYKMQLILDKVKNVYVLWNRWGRIGETGDYQRTPFGSFELGSKEFKKIFKSKTKNIWEARENFVKQEKKYLLLNFKESNLMNKDLLEPYNFKKLPPSNFITQQIIKNQSSLDQFEIYNFLIKITDCALYYKAMNDNRINKDQLNLNSLNAEIIEKARKILLDAKKVIDEIDKARRTAHNLLREPQKVQEILKKRDELVLLSNRYYELIPKFDLTDRVIEPLDLNRVNQEILLLHNLNYVESAVKILLASKLREKEINPIDYIYNCLQTKIQNLSKTTIEYDLIKTYCENTGQGFSIKNIFKIQRKGEAERLEEFRENLKIFSSINYSVLSNNNKNRNSLYNSTSDLNSSNYLQNPENILLFHGTKSFNLLGILANGIKIAPPEAPVTGYLYGKGVYLADCFSKSINYCDDMEDYDEDREVKGRYKYIMICEVALGKIKEVFSGDSFDYDLGFLEDGYNSVLSYGSQCPDPSSKFVLNDGNTIPLGRMVSNNRLGYKRAATNYPEYVVYNTDQIRIKYLIQVKVG